MLEVWAVFRIFEHFPYAWYSVMNAVAQLAKGIILLHNSTHPHVAYRVQDQLNAMLNMTHPIALNTYVKTQHVSMKTQHVFERYLIVVNAMQ
jgi:hypothetical protein